MPYCAVPECRNGTNFTNRRDSNVSFHRFPSGTRGEDWWLAIKREGSLSEVKDPRVCSEHFVEGDYERDLKHELLNPGVPKKNPKLLFTTNPSRNIPSSHPGRYRVKPCPCSYDFGGLSFSHFLII